jgi:hypothetical protein
MAERTEVGMKDAAVGDFRECGRLSIGLSGHPQTVARVDTIGMMNVQQAVPFFQVSNIEESIRYYVAGLGFAMTNQWIDEGKLRWCWLQLGGAALMLQEFRKDMAPEGKLGLGVSICFQCKTRWRFTIR